jgi:hypothetical protein
VGFMTYNTPFCTGILIGMGGFNIYILPFVIYDIYVGKI